MREIVKMRYCVQNNERHREFIPLHHAKKNTKIILIRSFAFPVPIFKFEHFSNIRRRLFFACFFGRSKKWATNFWTCFSHKNTQKEIPQQTTLKYFYEIGSAG